MLSFSVCLTTTRQLPWKYFLTARKYFYAGDRQAWSASSKNLPSAKFACALHLLEATFSICFPFPSFRLCLARSQGPGGGHAWKSSHSSVFWREGNLSPWGIDLMVEPQARGQTVSQGTFWGGVEVSPGPSRSLSGGDYEKWLGKASSCLVSLNCMFGGRRFDLNLLRCRFCCQGISGGEICSTDTFQSFQSEG